MAIMWKRHKEEPRPVAVECPNPSWPHHDVDGDTIYENSHFPTEEACWQWLERDILAGVSLAGGSVASARADLRRREKHAGEAAEEWAAFVRLRDARRRQQEQK